jgi:peptidoglycan/LPS O-acetylase OafA/YrhL
MPYRSARSEALDAVRGIAILLVLSYHHFGFAFGWTGPRLFFVLSGYLVGGTLLDQRYSSCYWETFYARRAFRILPLYWVFLAVVALLVGLRLPLWQYLTFTQNIAWVWDRALELPPAGVTWTLAIEEQFYLILPAVIRFVPAKRLPCVLLIAALGTPLWRVLLCFATGSAPAGSALLPSQADALFGGALLAVAARSDNRRLWLRVILTVAGISGIGLVIMQATSGLSLTIPFVAIVGNSLVATTFIGVVAIASVTSRRLPMIGKPLAMVGVGAYSIYLSNDMVFQALDSRWLGLLATFALAWVSWISIERPLISYARCHWSYRDRIFPVQAEYATS